MTWWAIAPPLLVAVIILVVPGLLIAYSASARSVTAWGIAPALSLTTIAVLGTTYGIAGVPWRLWSVLPGLGVIMGLCALAAWLLRRRFRPAEVVREPRSLTLLVLAGLLIAALVIAIRFAVAFHSPDAVSQTFDANFHLSGVRYVLTSGNVDPLTFSNLGNPSGGFYPNLWHMLAALVVSSSGASIPVGTNGLSIAVGAVAWPLSCVFLVRQLLGRQLLGLVAAALVSTSFAAFPLLLVTFGVLYPNLLSLAVLPAALGTLVIAFGYATERPLGSCAAWLAAVGVLPGLTLAHPNGLASLMYVAAPLLVISGWRYIRRARAGTSRAPLWLAALVAVVVVIGYVAAYIILRPPAAASTWGPTLGPWRALFDAAVNAQLGPPAVLMSLLVVLGAVGTFALRRNRWLVASALIIDFFYVATAYLPLGPLRYWVTGTWYSDVFRLIALEPLILVPLAVIGLTWGAGLIALLLRKRWDRSPTLPIVMSLLTFAAVVVANAGPAMTHMSSWASTSYRLGAHSVLLTADERSLLDRVPAQVPAGVVVAGDPWTGTSLVWAISDRKALVPAIYGAFSPETTLILHSLRSATPGSPVCQAVVDEHVGYVLDFGTDGVFGKTSQYPGVHHLSTSKAVAMVDHVGKAALYRITGCR